MKALLRSSLLVAFVLALAACASLPGTTTERIDHRDIEYVLVRHEAPAVVFENGLGGTVNWWTKVFPSIAHNYTAFAYNRPGYGQSAAVTTPRDGEHIVDELRGLLRDKGISPPYVLVGHSLGGLYMQYFARRYPDEVAALVLVDSTHPKQLRGKGSRDNWPFWLRAGSNVLLSSTAKDELNAADLTGQEVLALSDFTGKPVVLLNATDGNDESSDLATDAYEKRRDLARLYPGAKVVWVDGGHAIPLDKPEAVIDAIHAVSPLPSHRSSSD